MAYDMGAKIDSLCVVNQMNGKIQVRGSKMLAYLDLAKEKSKLFKNFTIEAIPIVHLSTMSIESESVIQIKNQEYN